VSRSARNLFRTLLFVFVGLCVGSALLEHVLEARDAARLTENETFYSVRGRRLRYHLTGVGEPGPTVVLLCGLAGSLEQWEHVQAELSEAYPVVSYDRSGLGFSDASDAHDAAAQAEELDAILHIPNISPPFVLVSYSSTVSVARVFRAAHPAVVTGLVFLDPTAPDAIQAMPAEHRYSHRKNFARPMASNLVRSFFGVTRLKQFIAHRHDVAPQSLSAERVDAILASFHHWVATAYEVLDLDRSEQEAKATPWFGSLPLGVLSSFDPNATELNRVVVGGNRDLATKSTRGIFRTPPHFGHDKILTDPVMYGAVVDLVRTITEEARGKE
jgi:pimeloyl-ACP methyl ester carboxylesterase